MWQRRRILLSSLAAGMVGAAAFAHFQVLLPSDDGIGPDDPPAVALDILFTHPMAQGPVMAMGKPKRFGVLVNGQRHDLLTTLHRQLVDGAAAFAAEFKVTDPGDHVFYLEPAPYWEPVERKMIIHYTKVVVDVLGGGNGWDARVEFPVEIEPLVRPYGLWTGNIFRGIVRRDGRAVPFATVEVAYYNTDHVSIPDDSFRCQVIKADANGVFAYAMPRAGWWGFAALVDGVDKMPSPDGVPVAVELGGLMWVRTVDMVVAD